MRGLPLVVLSFLLVACNGGAQKTDDHQSAAVAGVTLVQVRFVETQAIFELSNRSSSPIAFDGNETADMAFPRHYGMECRLPTGSQDDWSEPDVILGSWTSTQTIEVPSDSSKLLSVDAQYARQQAGRDCRLRLTMADGRIVLSHVFSAPPSPEGQ